MKFDIYEPAEDSFLMSEVLEKELPFLLQKNPHLKFFEMGPGSGVQLQKALKLGVKKENIFAADRNPDAVDHCKELGFACLESNLFENITGSFDVIIFNPPYLPEDSREPIESRLATTGGKTGSEVINRFLRQAKNNLSSDGKIFLLTSSLTEGIKWLSFKKKLLATKKVFQEELFVWELTV